MAKKEAKSSKDKKSFFKSFKAELKKVIWPTPKQLVNNTVAVITIVLITAAIVFILDLTFEAINKQGIQRIKNAIETNEIVSENTNTDEDADYSNAEDQTSEEINVEDIETNTQVEDEQ